MRLSLCCRYYRHYTLVELAFAEVYHTVNKSVECVILTLCYTGTGEVFVATLANYNVTCNNSLTTINLNTKSL